MEELGLSSNKQHNATSLALFCAVDALREGEHSEGQQRSSTSTNTLFAVLSHAVDTLY